LPRGLQLLWRRLVRLLHELVEKDDSPFNDRAIEHPGNSFGRLDPQLEEPTTHRSRMRHAQIWTMDLHALRVSNETGDEAAREGQDFILNPPTEEADGPGHDRSIAFTLCMMTKRTRANLTSHPESFDLAGSEPTESGFGQILHRNAVTGLGRQMPRRAGSGGAALASLLHLHQRF
jgi:hypothetical protein